MKYFFALILLFFDLTIFADDEKYLKEIDGKFRYAMELEVPARAMANLIRFYDFKSIEEVRSHIPELILDDYIINSPTALKNLPQEVQVELTKGLGSLDISLDQATQIPEKSNGFQLENTTKELSKPSGIIIPGEQQSPNSNSQILLPGQGQNNNLRAQELILPKEKNTDHIEKKIKQEEAIKNWQEVNKRWNKLPFKRKASLIRWEDLGVQKSAKVIMSLAKDIKLKDSFENLPGIKSKEHAKQIKELFERLSFHNDLNSLEFNYKDDVIQTNPKQYLDDLYLLADLVGARRQLDEPELTFRDTSYHFNASKLGEDIAKSKLETRADMINDYWFARIILRGDIEHASREDGFVNYRSGFVRLNENRVETRLHHNTPKEELIEITQLINKDPKELRETVGPKIEKALNVMIDNYDTLSKTGKDDFHFLINKGWGTKNQYSRYLEKIKIKGKLHYINELIKMKEVSESNPLLSFILDTEKLDFADLEDMNNTLYNNSNLSIKEYLDTIKQYFPDIPMESNSSLVDVIRPTAVFMASDPLEKNIIELTSKLLLKYINENKRLSPRIRKLLLDPRVYERQEVLNYFRQVNLGDRNKTTGLTSLLAIIHEQSRDNHPYAKAIVSNFEKTLQKININNDETYSELVNNRKRMLELMNLSGLRLNQDTAIKFEKLIEKIIATYFNNWDTIDNTIEILEKSQDQLRPQQLKTIINALSPSVSTQEGLFKNTLKKERLSKFDKVLIDYASPEVLLNENIIYEYLDNENLKSPEDAELVMKKITDSIKELEKSEAHNSLNYRGLLSDGEHFNFDRLYQLAKYITESNLSDKAQAFPNMLVNAFKNASPEQISMAFKLSNKLDINGKKEFRTAALEDLAILDSTAKSAVSFHLLSHGHEKIDPIMALGSVEKYKYYANPMEFEDYLKQEMGLTQEKRQIFEQLSTNPNELPIKEYLKSLKDIFSSSSSLTLNELIQFLPIDGVLRSPDFLSPTNMELITRFIAGKIDEPNFSNSELLDKLNKKYIWEHPAVLDIVKNLDLKDKVQLINLIDLLSELDEDITKSLRPILQQKIKRQILSVPTITMSSKNTKQLSLYLELANAVKLPLDQDIEPIFHNLSEFIIKDDSMVYKRTLLDMIDIIDEGKESFKPSYLEILYKSVAGMNNPVASKYPAYIAKEMHKKGKLKDHPLEGLFLSKLEDVLKKGDFDKMSNSRGIMVAENLLELINKLMPSFREKDLNNISNFIFKIQDNFLYSDDIADLVSEINLYIGENRSLREQQNFFRETVSLRHPGAIELAHRTSELYEKTNSNAGFIFKDSLYFEMKDRLAEFSQKPESIPQDDTVRQKFIQIASNIKIYALNNQEADGLLKIHTASNGKTNIPEKDLAIIAKHYLNGAIQTDERSFGVLLHQIEKNLNPNTFSISELEQLSTKLDSDLKNKSLNDLDEIMNKVQVRLSAGLCHPNNMMRDLTTTKPPS